MNHKASDRSVSLGPVSCFSFCRNPFKGCFHPHKAKPLSLSLSLNSDNLIHFFIKFSREREREKHKLGFERVGFSLCSS